MNKVLTYWLNDEWVGLESLPKPDLFSAGGFESILYTPEGMPLFSAHYQRLTQGLRKDFGLDLLPPPSYLQELIAQLIFKNQIEGSAKIRVRVFKYDLDEAWNLLLEAIPLTENAYQWNELGWQVGLYAVDKSQLHSSYKRVDRSVYLAASSTAKSQGYQDALLMDDSNQLIESSIGNIFYFRSGQWYTIPLKDAGINGIMRSVLLEILGAVETPLHANELHQVEDLFICNAVRGICWVRSCADIQWPGTYCRSAFQQLIEWQRTNSK